MTSEVKTKKETFSPCHNVKLIASLGDGVLIGSCGECYKNISRVNPATGVTEWLDGKSPWTEEPLRPVTEEE